MQKKESVYQRLPFYYGWLVFLATFLIFMFMYGLRYSVSVFFVPLQNEFGWSSATTAGAVTVFFWVYGFSALFVGRLYKRIGVRKILSLGGLLLGIGGALSSFVKEPWHLYLTWGVLASVGATILYLIPNVVLARFFLKHRGKAVGWSSMGISVAQAALIPFAAWIIANYGWRLSFIVLGTLVIIGVALPGYFIFRESPESIGLKKDGDRLDLNEKGESVQTESSGGEGWTATDALRTRSFRCIMASYFFVIGGTQVMLTFVVPHFVRLGIDPLLASTAMGVVGIMSLVGSFAFGFISDWLGRRRTIAIASGGMAVSMLISTIIPPNIVWLYAWVALYGSTYGGAPEQFASIVTDYFGRREDVGLFAFVHCVGAIGGGLFPLIGGYLADVTGSYYASLTFIGLGMIGAVIAILLAKPVDKPGSLPTERAVFPDRASG
jgi:MFS family permease